jgi:hypothetical protein
MSERLQARVGNNSSSLLSKEPDCNESVHLHLAIS